MNLTFHRKRISGILAVVPSRELSFIEEMKNYRFPEARSLKLMEVMGYDKRRIADPCACFSDFAVRGLEHLFERGVLRPEEIDALLVVTHSGDYLLPPTSNVIQGRLGLGQDTLCLDIAQACAGFVVGLSQAFMLLEHEPVRKVALINGDILSRRSSPQDRSLYPLIGDAVAITIVERDPGDSIVHAGVKMDGSRWETLCIPAGGLRQPCTDATAVLEDAGDNNFRAQNHLRMDGSAIFNFVQTAVPSMVEELLARAGMTVGDIDCFLCHQANRYMVRKLAEKMNIPPEKVPSNVVGHFGNSSGATIPVAAALNLSEQLTSGEIRACLVGYGAGLTWSAMVLRLGKLDICEILEFQ